VAPEEAEAQVYTHDKKLLASLSLGEGRQRVNAYSTLLLLAHQQQESEQQASEQQESENQQSLAHLQHLLRQRDAQMQEKEKEMQEKEEAMREKEEELARLTEKMHKARQRGGSVRRKRKR
jgi:protein subunit release factor B